MELVDILRVLVRRRIGVVVALALSVLAGAAVQYQISLLPPRLGERVSTSSTAHTRLLLTAPAQPPTVDLNSELGDTLGLRAGLLADRMTTYAVRQEIAERAGIRPEDLAVLSPASQGPPLAVPIGVEAADAARLTSEPYALSMAADPTIPIVSFSVAAPDAEGARHVAQAATAAYEGLVAAGTGPKFHLSVEKLGTIRTQTTVSRPSKMIGIAAAFVVFVLVAAGLVLLHGLRMRLRPAELVERESFGY